MNGLLEEMRRRNVFRVAAAYLVVGWVVLQVAELLVPILDLPDWTIKMAFFVGLIGFPFALLFAWAFELTPEGLKRSEDVTPDDSITSETGQSLNRAITGLLVVAVVILLVDRFLPNRGADTEVIEQTPEISEASTTADKPRSVAVLPFVNMSDDPKQEYFSDGISEELLNGLAKINELRVAARTSSFAFKGQNQDIKNIGEQLNVQTVLEGSVRKAGQRVRITAQLINVDDGYHLWSETYDRDLTDIFAIQDEISAAIVDALKVHLTDGEPLESRKAVDLEAYNFYLLARHSLRRRTEKSLQIAQQQYQKAIDIDPTYAAAWAGKATATELLSEQHYGTAPIEDSRRQAQAMLDMAFSLDKDLPEAHATQALIYLNHERPHQALVHVDAAIKGNPSEGILYAWRSSVLTELGRWDEADAAEQLAYRSDPLHQSIRHNVAASEAAWGNRELAREMVVPGSELAYEIDGWIANRQGRYADQAKAFEAAIEAAEGGYDNRLSFAATINYLFNLGNAEAARRHAQGLSLLLVANVENPVAAYQAMATMPESQRNRFTTGMMAFSLIMQDRCEEMLALYADDNLAEQPVWGNLADGGNRVDRLAAYAWCLRQTGDREGSRALATRLKNYIDEAVANGQPPTYFRTLATVQMLLDEADSAMASLKLAWQHYWLDWTDFNSPIFAELDNRQEFKDLRDAVYSHMNSERAKLDWEPVEVASSM